MALTYGKVKLKYLFFMERMFFMENCIFCKIINQEIPSYKIYEDDKVYAFLDISQATKGHTIFLNMILNLQEKFFHVCLRLLKH